MIEAVFFELLKWTNEWKQPKHMVIYCKTGSGTTNHKSPGDAEINAEHLKNWGKELHKSYHEYMEARVLTSGNTADSTIYY